MLAMPGCGRRCTELGLQARLVWQTSCVLLDTARGRIGAQKHRHSPCSFVVFWACHGAGRRVWQKYLGRKGSAYKHWQNNLTFSYCFKILGKDGWCIFLYLYDILQSEDKNICNIFRTHLELKSQTLGWLYLHLFVITCGWIGMIFHTKAPKVEWWVPECVVCGYRLNGRASAHSFQKQVKLRREDFQTQTYYMKTHNECG